MPSLPGMKHSLSVVVCRRWLPPDGPQTARLGAGDTVDGLSSVLSLVLSCRLSARRSNVVSAPQRSGCCPVGDKRQATRQAGAGQEPLAAFYGKSVKERPTAACSLAARCARAATTVGAQAVRAPQGAWTLSRGGKPSRSRERPPMAPRRPCGAAVRAFLRARARRAPRPETAATRKLAGQRQLQGSTGVNDATSGCNCPKSGGMTADARARTSKRSTPPARRGVLLLLVRENGIPRGRRQARVSVAGPLPLRVTHHGSSGGGGRPYAPRSPLLKSRLSLSY